MQLIWFIYFIKAGKQSIVPLLVTFIQYNIPGNQMSLSWLIYFINVGKQSYMVKSMTK